MKEEQNIKKGNTFSDWFDTMPCGYILADDDARILRINASLCEQLGWTKEELEGKKKFTDLLSVGGQLYYQTTHAPLSKLQSEVRELSYKLVSKDKVRMPVLVNSSREKLGDENQFSFGNILDSDQGIKESEYITQFVIFPFSDRQKFEEKLLVAKKQAESAAEAKSVFLSTMTHELRNPIHSILNASNLLTFDEVSEENQELLDIINFSAKGLLELVNSVLDMSKMEAGNISLVEKPFDLRRLLHRIVQSFRPQAEKKGLRLEWKMLTEKSLQFIADEIKIKQVITNLIGNAVKFTKEGSVRLILDYKESENELSFKVEDTGIGINPDIVEKIFTPFSQANESIHTNFGGTGLGLSISQKILGAYGSRLEVSGEEGKGAIFSFKLKLQPTNKVELEKTITNCDLRNLSHLKVLVADDVKSNLIIIGRYFKKWDIAYDTAKNGQEAIDLIFENDYDIVFLDIGMPILSGLDVAKMIRAKEAGKYAKLPLLALTAYDKKDMSESIMQSGMNQMLQKPFSEAELYDVICAYTELDATEKSAKKKSIKEEDMSDNIEVNFDSLYDLFDNDRPDVKSYLQAVSNDLGKTMLDFVQAEKKFDLKMFKDAVHKLKSVVRMLELKEFKDLLSRQQQFLEEGNRTEFAKIGEERLLLMKKIRAAVQVEMES